MVDIPDEWIEAAIRGEKSWEGKWNWPDDWSPAMANQYREAMRAALTAVLPLILERAAGVADQEASHWQAEHEAAQNSTGKFGIVSGILSAAAANRASGARDVATAIRALGEPKP